MPLDQIIRDVQAQAAIAGVGCPTMKTQDVMDALYQRHFTGAIVVHFKDGKIAALDVPNPIKIRVE